MTFLQIYMVLFLPVIQWRSEGGEVKLGGGGGRIPADLHAAFPARYSSGSGILGEEF